MSAARHVSAPAEVSAARHAKMKRLEASRAPALRLADRIIAVERARKDAPRGLTRRQRRNQAATLPRLASDAAIEPVARVLDDPYAPGEKLSGTVNRRVDVLELERSHRRISEAAFLTGRHIQATFERAELSGGSNWSGADRVDAELAKEKRIIRNVDTARAINVEMGRLGREVGEIGSRLLRRILTGTSFVEEAAARGRPGIRGVTAVAEQFRWLLEGVAEKRAAAGPRPGQPDDHFTADWCRAQAARQAAVADQG